jgi:hypothetical protein
MPARKDQSSAGPFHVSLPHRTVKHVGVAQRKHRMNQKPRLNHRQRCQKQVQSAGLLERLVFPENQNPSSNRAAQCLRVALVKLFDGLVAVCGADQLEAFRLDHGAERIEQRPVIIDQEDPGFVHGGGVPGPA